MSHLITPEPKDMKWARRRPKTKIEEIEERAQALRTSDVPGDKKKKTRAEPLKLGIRVDSSTK